MLTSISIVNLSILPCNKSPCDSSKKSYLNDYMIILRLIMKHESHDISRMNHVFIKYLQCLVTLIDKKEPYSDYEPQIRQ